MNGPSEFLQSNWHGLNRVCPVACKHEVRRAVKNVELSPVAEGRLNPQILTLTLKFSVMV